MVSSDDRGAPQGRELSQEGPFQVSERVRCARCEVSGAVTWEEEPPAVPYVRARNRLRKLVGLTAGFKSIDRGARNGPEIACYSCGARLLPL